MHSASANAMPTNSYEYGWVEGSYANGTSTQIAKVQFDQLLPYICATWMIPQVVVVNVQLVDNRDIAMRYTSHYASYYACENYTAALIYGTDGKGNVITSNVEYNIQQIVPDICDIWENTTSTLVSVQFVR